MRAIKIDPLLKAVLAIQVDDSYQAIKEAVAEHMNGDYFCLAFTFDYMGKEHVCFVNDEGLLQEPPHEHYFAWAGLGVETQPFAGTAIIFQNDSEGDCASCEIPISLIKTFVYWFSLEQVREFIRKGLVDYNSYYIPVDQNNQPIHEKKELLSKLDLGAFDSE